MYQLGCKNLCFFLSERRLKGGVGVFPWEASGRQDRMRERESYREIILENIDYDILTQDEKLDRDRLDELVELMVDTVCSNREMIRIAGDDYPAEVVRSRFLKLNTSHIEYVLDRMRENTTYVRNIAIFRRYAPYRRVGSCAIFSSMSRFSSSVT